MTDLWTCPGCGKQVNGTVDTSPACPHCGQTHPSVESRSIAGSDTAAGEQFGRTLDDAQVANQRASAPGTVADIQLPAEVVDESQKTFVAGDRTVVADDFDLASLSDLSSPSIADSAVESEVQSGAKPELGTVFDTGDNKSNSGVGTEVGDEALFTLVDPEIASQLLAGAAKAGDGTEAEDPTKTIVAADRTLQASDVIDPSKLTNADADAVAGSDRTIQGGATIVGSIRGSGPVADENEATNLSVHERSFVPHRESVAQRGSDYELMKMLGEGGMGVVYAARQASIDRIVAVKMLKPESVNHSGQRSKFLAEAAVTGELEHPNIVPIYDLGKNASGALFYAMKRVQGTPWHKTIASKSTSDNVDVLMRVADAIAFAHKQGVIHRDLKPENVMLGEFGEVLVMDWGLALPVNRKSAGGIQIKPTMGGTPAYMAPEMATGPFDKLSFASDIYLLGAILFEIVTGKPPHSGVTVMKCLVAAARNEITKTTKSGELLDIAMKAMETDPADRYQTVKEFQQAIKDYRDHLESILLSDRAHEDLERASALEDYSHFSRAVFGFEEALALWADNKRAKQGLSEAKLKYARVAKGKGDFDLATSLLDASAAGHAELLAEVNAAIEEREARVRRLASMKRAAFAMAGLMFVVVTSALVYVVNANRNERVARKEAEDSRNIAQAAQREEAVQREAAELNAQIAEENRVKAVESAEIAERNRLAAEESARIAEENRVAAEESAMIAEVRRQEAVDAQQAAEVARAEEQVARQLAEEERMKAVEAQEKEAMARLAAEDAERETARALEEEEKQRRLADERRIEAIAARDEAQRQREIAEYEAYVARINAASAKIDEQNFDQARALLQACTPEDGQNDYRGWEWHRLWYLCHQSQRDISLDLPAESICFAPDGRSFVVGGLDGSAQIRGFDGELVAVLESRGSRIMAADWSQNQPLALNHQSSRLISRSERSPGIIALGSDDSAEPVQLFDAATGQSLDLLQDEEGHSAAVTSLQFSADGKRLLTASFDRTVKLWDLESGAVLKSFVGHRLWVWSARFSPDEKFVVSASEDGTVRIWNIETGESSEPFLGHEGPVYSADFSADGRWVASGGIDGLLLQWSWDRDSLIGFDHRQAIRDFQAGRPIEARTLRGLRILAGHTASIRSVRFGERAGEAVIVSTGHDHTIRLWDVETGVEEGTLRGHGRWVRCCDVSPDGAWIVSAGFDGTARLWETGQSGETQVLQAQTLRGHDDSILDAAFSQDGSMVLTASRDRTARQWETESGQLSHTFQEGHSFLTKRVVVHPSGESMITAAVDGTARVWNIEDGRELRVWTETGRTGVLAVSPDGLAVVTGDEANSIQLHAFDDERSIRPAEIHAAPVVAAAFSTDSARLATGDERGRLVLWSRAGEDWVSEEPSGQALRHHTDRITDVLWLSDSLIVTTSRDRTAALWSLDDLENPRIISGSDDWMSAAKVSNDRLLLLGRSGNLKLIDAQSLSELHSLTLEVQTESSSASPRTTRLAVGSNGRCVVVDEGRKKLFWVSIVEDRLALVQSQDDSSSVDARRIDLSDASFLIDDSALIVVGGATSQLIDIDGTSIDRQGLGGVRRRYESQEALSSIALSQKLDDHSLVTASWDGSLFVWDSEQGIVVRKLEGGHSGRVTAVAIADSGEWIASADDSGRLVIWDRANGSIKASLETEDPIRCLAMIPADGIGTEMMLLGSDSGRLSLFDANGKLLQTWNAHDRAVLAVSALVDEGVLRIASAGADNRGKAWTLSLGASEEPKVVTELTGHSASINDIDWSPDGERLVTASDDFTVKLWDADTGKELLTLRGHDREVTSAQFDPQGTRILSAAHDGLAIVWLTESATKRE